MENENHVEVANVKKIYKGGGGGGVAAVDGITLNVPRGQFLGVMGPSGSGKTTLLHMIAGLTQATSGDVRVSGKALGSMSDRELTLFRRMNIGIVFQAFNLIPTLTAEENIILPILAGHRSGISAERMHQALDALLERLKLVDRRTHYPDALSGGEQQRVTIARALFMDFVTDTHGSLLLADEPTGNLDSANGELICRMLRELCSERGHTMIVVTHEPAVARWTDRVVSLKDGRIVGDIPSGKLEA